MDKWDGGNVYLDHLKGELQLSFECPHYSDADTCPYCLSDIMPPEEVCHYFLKDDCEMGYAKKGKADALKKLVAFGKKKLKMLEDAD